MRWFFINSRYQAKHVNFLFFFLASPADRMRDSTLCLTRSWKKKMKNSWLAWVISLHTQSFACSPHPLTSSPFQHLHPIGNHLFSFCSPCEYLNEDRIPISGAMQATQDPTWGPPIHARFNSARYTPTCRLELQRPCWSRYPFSSGSCSPWLDLPVVALPPGRFSHSKYDSHAARLGISVSRCGTDRPNHRIPPLRCFSIQPHRTADRSKRASRIRSRRPNSSHYRHGGQTGFPAASFPSGVVARLRTYEIEICSPHFLTEVKRRIQIQYRRQKRLCGFENSFDYH